MKHVMQGYSKQEEYSHPLLRLSYWLESDINKGGLVIKRLVHPLNKKGAAIFGFCE